MSALAPHAAARPKEEQRGCGHEAGRHSDGGDGQRRRACHRLLVSCSRAANGVDDALAHGVLQLCCGRRTDDMVQQAERRKQRLQVVEGEEDGEGSAQY
jgi:hypothetical protein